MTIPKDLRSSFGLTLGCDPEVFVTRVAGRVQKRVAAVGSESILLPNWSNTAVTRDGVQVELHAGGGTGCRQSLAYSIGTAFTALNEAVKEARTRLKDPSLAISFQPMVELTRGDIARLSPEARELNCKPSLNAYGREPVKKDGNIYPIRSASGHLHFGTALPKNANPNDIVKVLDALVGIPCVLVDRSPSQAIRRETYGLAGEYRLPYHGLEYRVPSNFWLLDYKLESMVFGLAKVAMRVAEGHIQRGNYNKWAKNALLDKIDFSQVEQAINTNDFDLALRIYKESIRPFADQIISYMGLGNGMMDAFEYFIDRVHEKGLEHWFKIDDAAALSRWLTIDTNVGWERFLMEIVEPARKSAKFTGIILDPVITAKSQRRNKAVVDAESVLPIAA